MNIKNSLKSAGFTAAVFAVALAAALSLTPSAKAQGNLVWKFDASNPTASATITTPSVTNSYAALWSLNTFLGTDSTTFHLNYTIDGGKLSVTRSSAYGLDGILGLSTSPVDVTQGSDLIFTAWLLSGTGDQFSEIDNITINGISVAGGAFATALNPNAQLDINLGSILPSGSSLISLGYDYITGDSLTGTTVNGGHSVLMVGAVPEPSSMAYLGLSILCSIPVIFRKRQ